jgi:hypothetical protein
VSDPPVLLDTVAIAAALGIKPGRMRIWAYRGHLTRQGRDDRGRSLYDLAEAFQVQADLHRRQSTSEQ